VTAYGPAYGDSGSWMHVLRHEVTDGPGRVMQSKRKRCQGVLGEIRREERFSASELRQDTGTKREVTYVLLGRLGPKKTGSWHSSRA
jgi:hypothetical protein